MREFFSVNRIIILCVLGSIIRLIFGYIYTPWQQAPDHLAWEIIIEQGNLQYDHLIHYPHEGGSFLISLLGQFIELFTNISSLTISAFILDFVIRFIQIKIVKKIFNIKIATLFGVWTVFATPTIIPWGTVNFGLHALSAIFPFLLLLLLHQKRDTIKHHILCGVFLGVALWFSYINLILIPAFFLYRLMSRTDIKRLLYSLLGFIGVIILHILVRKFLDAGFQLNELGLTSIRGVDFSIHDIDILNRLTNLPTVVANSTLAIPQSNLYMPSLRLLYYFVFIVACIGMIIYHKKNNFAYSNYMIIPIIIFFLVVYTFSPFFELRDMGSYIYFRHLTYILPLLSLFIIAGLSSYRYKVILIAFFILGMVRTGQLFTTQISPKSDGITKAAGWIIGTKLGHDAKAIVTIIEDNPDSKILLRQGVGWGISASLLFDNDNLDKIEAETKLIELVELISTYPKAYQIDLLEGVKFSFNEGLTPRLNPELRLKIEQIVNSKK
ncbi:hypothetical protein [Crocinitomix catalasitica]|uniref:hypothetical protein n=1 Tax=Crocinitomix catalasitica TaxID=184607 RepID=UPI00055EE5A6|nr:hypothetical protein [Crocinitomix catalasitica]